MSVIEFDKDRSKIFQMDLKALNSADMTPKGRKTRRAIIDATRHIAGRDGIDSVSVMGVCEAASVGRTSFYNYFPDISSLLEQTASEAFHEYQRKFDEIHGEHERGFARLGNILAYILDIAHSDTDEGLLITALAMKYPFSTSFIREEIRNEIEAAIASGQVEMSAKDVNCYIEVVATSVLSLARKFAEEKLVPTDIGFYIVSLLCASGISKTNLISLLSKSDTIFEF